MSYAASEVGHAGITAPHITEGYKYVAAALTPSMTCGTFYITYGRTGVRYFEYQPLATGSIVKLPDRTIHFVYHPKARPLDTTFDVCLSFSPFEPRSWADQIGVSHFLISAYHGIGERIRNRSFKRNGLKLIADSGGAQLKFDVVKFVDPREVAWWMNECADIGMTLDFAPRPVDQGNKKALKLLAQESRKANKFFVRNKADNLKLVNITHGFCVTGDTLVSTDLGLVRLDSLGSAPVGGAKRISTSVAGLGHPAKATLFYNSGVKPTRKVTTRNGYEVTGTLVHPLLTLRDGVKTWVKLGDLRLGDYVAISREGHSWPVNPVVVDWTFEPLSQDRNSETYKAPSHVTEDLGTVLGYLLSEGAVNRRGHILFGNTDKRLISDFKRAWTACFPDCAIRSSTRQFKHYPGSKPYHQCIVHSVYVREFLVACGLDRSKAAAKTIPWSILQSPKKVVANFLRAFYDGDGTCNRNGVQAWSSSTDLLRQLQILLLRFGVVTRRCDPEKYVLIAEGHNATLLSTEIGPFCSKHKNFKFKAQGAHSKTDIIPGLAELAYALRQDRSVALNGRHGYKNDDGAIVHVRFPRQARINGRTVNFTYDSLRKPKALSALRSISATFGDEVDELLRINAFWDPVVSLTNTGRKQVYDLTVAKDHAFSGNGIICHNTLDQVRAWTDTVAMPGFDGWAAGADTMNNNIANLRNILQPMLEQPPVGHYHLFGFSGRKKTPAMAWMARRLAMLRAKNKQSKATVTSDSTTWLTMAKWRAFMTFDPTNGHSELLPVGKRHKLQKGLHIPCSCFICAQVGWLDYYDLPPQTHAGRALGLHNLFMLHQQVEFWNKHAASSNTVEEYLRIVDWAFGKKAEIRNMVSYVDTAFEVGLEKADRRFRAVLQDRPSRLGMKRLFDNGEDLSFIDMESAAVNIKAYRKFGWLSEKPTSPFNKPRAARKGSDIILLGEEPNVASEISIAEAENLLGDDLDVALTKPKRKGAP